MNISHNAISIEYLGKIHQVVLDGIIDNMAELVHTGQYGAIHTTNTNHNWLLSY